MVSIHFWCTLLFCLLTWRSPRVATLILRVEENLLLGKKHAAGEISHAHLPTLPALAQALLYGPLVAIRGSQDPITSDTRSHSHAGDPGAASAPSTLPHQHQGSAPETACQQGSPSCPSPWAAPTAEPHSPRLDALLLQLHAESIALRVNGAIFFYS